MNHDTERSYDDVCLIMTFVGYDVCRLIRFATYNVCRIIKFVTNYDNCCL